MTSVPPPGECRGAGLFPGLAEEQVRRAREHEGERIPLSREVTITLFAMPRVGACDEMARDLQALAPDFAPARFRLVTPKNREACIEHGVTGFPTLLVTWRGATVRVLDGYHTNEQVRAALADLFQPTRIGLVSSPLSHGGPVAARAPSRAPFGTAPVGGPPASRHPSDA